MKLEDVVDQLKLAKLKMAQILTKEYHLKIFSFSRTHEGKSFIGNAPMMICEMYKAQEKYLHASLK